MIYQNQLEKLTLWDKILLIYFVVMIIMLIIGYIPHGYPLTHFMTERGRFDDFFNSVDLARRLPIRNDGYQLSPGLIFIFRMIDQSISKIIFFLYNITCILLILKALRNLSLNFLEKLVLTLSYPVLFSIARGNAELLAFSLVLLSYSYLYIKDDKNSLITLLAAIFVKPTAIVWVLLMPFRIFKSGYKIILYFGLISLIVALSINSNLFNLYSDFSSSLNKYRNDYIYGSGGDLFNNSLWGFIKTYFYYIKNTHGIINVENIPNLFSRVNYVSYAMIILVLAYLFAIGNGNLFICSILVSSLPIIFSPVSCDYRLLYILIPIIIFIKSNFSGKNNNNLFLFILLLILITPKHFIEYKNLVYGNPATIQSIINPAIFIIILSYIFYKNFFHFKKYFRNNSKN